MITSSKELFDSAVKYAEKHSVPTVDKNTGIDRPLRWNGYDLAVDFDGHGEPGVLLIHEVNHYLCAPKKRRFKPEFGLGKSPSGYGMADRLVTPAQSEVEERRVATLDAVVLLAMGADEKLVWPWWHEVWGSEVVTFYEAGRGWARAWSRRSAMQEYDAAVNQLKRRGLLDEAGEARLVSMIPITDKMLKRGLKCPT